MTNHTFAQTTHVALPHQSCDVGGVPDIVNHAKFRRNRFRCFGSLRGRNPPFSCLALCLI